MAEGPVEVFREAGASRAFSAASFEQLAKTFW
jgi:hypothetical protein